MKDETIPIAVSPAPQPATPELLKAILNVNPNVFDEQQRAYYSNHLSTSKFNGISPAPSYSYSHNTVPSNPSPVGPAVQSASIPNQQLLAPPSQSSPNVNMGSPPSQARPGSQLNISAQNNVSPIWNNANSSNVYSSPLSNTACPNSQNGGFYNSLVQENRNFGTNIEDRDPLAMSPRNQTDEPMTMQSEEKIFEQGSYVVNLN